MIIIGTYDILKLLAFAIYTRQYLGCGISLQWKMDNSLNGIGSASRQLTHLRGGGTTTS